MFWNNICTLCCSNIYNKNIEYTKNTYIMQNPHIAVTVTRPGADLAKHLTGQN